MNQNWISFHLSEALVQLQEIIDNVEADPEYDYGDYVVDMSHLYHHLNTAWNSRDASDDEVANHSDEDFYRWRTFPSAEELLLSGD